MWRLALAVAVLALVAGCGGGGDEATVLPAVDAAAFQVLGDYAADPATTPDDMRAAADGALEVYAREPDALVAEGGETTESTLRRIADTLPVEHNATAVTIYEAIGPP